MPFSINPDLIENNDVEIQTVDGELALFHKPSGNTLIVDEDTTVSEKLQSPLRDNVDLDGNDLISGGSGEFAALEAGSLSTDLAIIGGREIEQVGDADDFSQDDSVYEIDGLNSGIYFLYYHANMDSTGSVDFYYNNDDSDESYGYWTQDGTRNTSQDVVELVDVTTRFPEAGGLVRIAAHDNQITSRFGAYHHFMGARASDIGGFATSIGYTGGELSSIHLDLIESDPDIESLVLELWKVI